MPARTTDRLSERDAARLAAEAYGLEVVAARLPGYASQNFRLDAANGKKYVLKVASEEETEPVLEFQNLVLERLEGADLGVRTPRLVASSDGRQVVEQSFGGELLRFRVMTWLSGRTWAEEPAAHRRRRELGAALGRIDRCLEGLRHPAARRDRDWDLRNAERQRIRISEIPEPGRRRLVADVFHRFAAYRTLYERELRRSVIHGDANDHNLLLEDGRLSGLLDVGDAASTWTISELAIAAAYALLGEEDPVAAAAEVTAGYHHTHPLTAVELQVLFPFLCGRLAQSVVLAARRRAAGDASEYHFVTEAPAWSALRKLAAVAPGTAHRRFLRACGLDPAPNSPERDELLTARTRHIGPSLSLAYDRPLHITRGYRQYLFDSSGGPYLDLVNNVCHVGHCHPAVVAAAKRQMATLNTNTRYLYDGLTAYAERLAATLPEGLDVCFFVNSGSEANELAIRLARAATGRRDLVVLDGAYHGHTTTLIDASPYKFLGKGGSGRAEPWVHPVPMPDPYRGPHRGAADAGRLYAAEVERAIAASENGVSAFLCEPILGCGGQIVPPDDFLPGAYDAIRAAGGLAIADEVQVGFGRVGSHFWAFETVGVVPDVVVLGKPIGNGHPLAAVVTRREIADAFANGMEFFATFGGNPVSCAIGMAVLDVIAEERLQERAQRLGRKLLKDLRGLAGRHPLIGDVRGAGLFAGVELVRDRDSLEPAVAEASRVVDRLSRGGLLLSTDGPFGNVLKIKPPMVLTADDVDFFVGALDRELAALEN